MYHWASITKTLTAIAIMQLRDRGLPHAGRPDHAVRSRAAAGARQLRLRWTTSPSGCCSPIRAGFQNPTWPYGEGRPWEPFEPTRWEQLVAMMPYQELAFAPGSRFGYSNPAFIYLARVIEALTGDPWAVYVQKNIWTPLGLTRELRRQLAVPSRRPAGRELHRPRRQWARSTPRPNPREFNPGITIPNSGWNAPIGDLVTYVAFLTHADGGDSALARRYDGVLRHATLEEMWRPIVPLAAGGGLDEAFGLSFYLYRRGATTVVGHTGEQSGFRSFVYFDPRTTVAVVGVLNTTNEARPEESNRGWDVLTHQAVAMVAP